MACLLGFSSLLSSLTAQGIVGIIKEEASHQPIEAATVSVLKNDSILATIPTNQLGQFTYTTTQAIRVRLLIAATGYKTVTSQDIVLDGYSTIRYEYQLERMAYELEGITIVATHSKTEPFLYRVTRDDLNTIAGNYDDPVRVVVSKPGIVQINDQANHISVRGQNPIFNTYYLEGLEIVNPNHTNNAGTFSDLGTPSGGGINMFSAQALGHTDIFTGLNPLSIGRTSGAVIDMHLHESAIREYRAKAGFLGFEFGGGMALGEKAILDANFRYSFTGLLANLGVDFGGERIGFYDGVLSFRHDGSRHKLKVFGWAGRSDNEFDHVQVPDEAERFKDFFDINYENGILGAGTSFEYALNSNTSFKIGTAYSILNTVYFKEGIFDGSEHLRLNLDLETRLLSSNAELSLQLSSAIETSLGLNYLKKTHSRYSASMIDPLLDDESFIRPYLNAAIELAPGLQFELGGELNMPIISCCATRWFYGYRTLIQWDLDDHNQFYAGLRHSPGQNIKTFPVEEPSTLPIIVDKYEIGWNLSLKKQSLSLTTYLQNIENLSVFETKTGFIHLTDQQDLVARSIYFDGSNNGEAQFYGIEGEWELWNEKGWKLNLNETIYKSQRRVGESEFSVGRYAGNHASHASLSKEIIRVKKEKNRIWNFSLRGILQGGVREQTIDEQSSDQALSTVFINEGTFNQRLSDYKRIDVSASRTIANQNIRWRFALDIQNLFNFTNIAYHYYDPFLQRIEGQEQLGIIPVFSVQASW